MDKQRWWVFGQQGHWSEWQDFGPTKKAALNRAASRLIYYGGGYIMDCKTNKEWRITITPEFGLKLTPWRPLSFLSNGRKRTAN